MAIVSLEIKNLDKVQDYYNKFPEIAGAELKKANNATLITIERRAKRNAPSDRGKLRKNTKRVATEQGGSLTFQEKYAAAVHEGTRPHHPPIQKGKGLALWAKRKGLNAYAVAKSIARKGTKGKPFLQDAVLAKKSTVNRIFIRALKNIISKGKI